MKNLKYIFFAFLMVLVGCEDDDAFGSVALSNLTVNTEVSDDGSGTVIFKPSASGAKSYNYNFGDGTTAESLTGFISKTYRTVGENILLKFQ